MSLLQRRVSACLWVLVGVRRWGASTRGGCDYITAPSAIYDTSRKTCWWYCMLSQNLTATFFPSGSLLIKFNFFFFFLDLECVLRDLTNALVNGCAISLSESRLGPLSRWWSRARILEPSDCHKGHWITLVLDTSLRGGAATVLQSWSFTSSLITPSVVDLQCLVKKGQKGTFFKTFGDQGDEWTDQFLKVKLQCKRL